MIVLWSTSTSSTRAWRTTSGVADRASTGAPKCNGIVTGMGCTLLLIAWSGVGLARRQRKIAR